MLISALEYILITVVMLWSPSRDLSEVCERGVSLSTAPPSDALALLTFFSLHIQHAGNAGNSVHINRYLLGLCLLDVLLLRESPVFLWYPLSNIAHLFCTCSQSSGSSTRFIRCNQITIMVVNPDLSQFSPVADPNLTNHNDVFPSSQPTLTKSLLTRQGWHLVFRRSMQLDNGNRRWFWDHFLQLSWK